MAKGRISKIDKITVAYLKCPFYMDNAYKSNREIKCESVFSESDIYIKFDNTTACRHHKENFCASNCFQSCPQYQLLMDLKYNDKYSEEVEERSNLKC